MSPNEEDHRPQFTEYLDYRAKNPVEGRECSGSATFYGVKAMNHQMVNNNVTMSKEHFEVAKSELEKPNPRLCDFLEAENPYVMKSTGSGAAYKAGFVVHQVINLFKEDQGKK